MNQDRYIFSQIVDFISDYELNICISRYSGNKRIKNLSCRDQFLALMFGQVTNLNSLRGIVLCLNAHPNSLYHLGFRTKKFTLSTLSRANQFRDWRIWQDFTNHLMTKARALYINDNDVSIELENSVYALDSTIIDLCLATFNGHTLNCKSPPSKSTLNLISRATFLHFSSSPRQKFMMSIFLIILHLNVTRSTSWIEDTCTLRDCIPFINKTLSSSYAPNKAFHSKESIPIPWIQPPDCVATKP